MFFNKAQKKQIKDNMYVIVLKINENMVHKLSQEQLDEFFSLFAPNFIVFFENMLSDYFKSVQGKLDSLFDRKKEDFDNKMNEIIGEGEKKLQKKIEEIE